MKQDDLLPMTARLAGGMLWRSGGEATQNRAERAYGSRHDLRKIGMLLALAAIATSSLHAQEKTLDDVLALSLEDLANMQVVSALKGPGTAKTVPATIRVISGEQLRGNGCFTLEDALADLPGFQFRNIQGFNSYVFLRGVPQQNNKIRKRSPGVR